VELLLVPASNLVVLVMFDHVFSLIHAC
jgi:hypothetical protein